MKRRDFLKLCAASAAAGGGLLGVSRFITGDEEEMGIAANNTETLKEAYYYKTLAEDEVKCELCFRGCKITPGETGFCRVRKNESGALYSQVYGRPSAVNIDPIEKEPMHHFHPGTRILCVGTASCNFRCKFCHNWHLSQRDIDEVSRVHNLTPQDVVQRAENNGVPAISFTYNEPTVFYEYMYDIARLAQQRDLNVIFHSNGGLRREPLQDLLQHIDAVTVDLKAFTEDFYRDIIQASRDPVLDSLKTIVAEDVWLEIVNLVLPGYNDDPENIREMATWINEELNHNVPLHFSRFSPSYQMTDLSPTPVETLETCRRIAREQGLNYVSIGNVPGHKANSTFCPECGQKIIDRFHFTVNNINLDNGSCGYCGSDIAGVWG